MQWYELVVAIVGGGAGIKAVEIAANQVSRRAETRLTREQALSEENTRLRESLEREEADSATWREKYFAVVDGAASFKAQVASLTAMVELLKEEVVILRDSNSALKTEVTELRESNRQLRSEVVELREQLHGPGIGG